MRSSSKWAYAPKVPEIAPIRWSLAVFSVAWITACASFEPGDAADADETETDTATPAGEFAPLIDHELWTTIEADEDPLVDHRPAEISCTVAGWFVENESLEINTNYCNYLAIGQPSLAAVTEGWRIQLGFYHFNLVALEPAIAHLAVLLDGQLLWEQEVEIPGTAMVHNLEFEAPFSAPAGSPLVFHLHNHGQNTWALQSISAEQ
jgi:hypothetical protein